MECKVVSKRDGLKSGTTYWGYQNNRQWKMGHRNLKVYRNSGRCLSKTKLYIKTWEDSVTNKENLAELPCII